MSVNYTTSSLNVAGLQVTVYKNAVLGDDIANLPVAVMILTHGRTGKHDDEYMLSIINSNFEYFNEQRKVDKPSRDLVIVAFDHRNHGHRTVNAKNNFSFGGEEGKFDTGNDTHVIDTYGIFTGTGRDYSFLVDFLPPYLYRNDERTIDLWIASGVSLGGNATWIALANEPRITMAIPIIGSPKNANMYQSRAAERGVPFAPPFVPNSMVALMQRLDPASKPNKLNEPGNPYVGKKILVLAGAEDKLVPHSVGASYIDELEVGPSGVKEVYVQPGTGHFPGTPEMQSKMVEFLWKYALGPAAA
ncbi:hypothetical protein CALVIDRAFT_530046 [Calocera viscosa TUFC12733]|uniref:Alpha/beta-hydrolase n=1 Tax=Calocera viscosa (strain TUFC12733) TaxID=1330018 RepID=A0A167IEB1_CALVF|nr:hypothetical protein CALVIDRAFT_530046 [Calocera viscosa TUFC12733]